MKKAIFFSMLVFLSMVLPCWSLDGDHFRAKYVPWGVDEYELLSLTTAQLDSKFKGKLRFEDNYSHAFLWDSSSSGPQFLLGIKNSRVTTVQRLFIDGMGCHILGPKLESKKEALEFSIEGLSQLAGGGDKSDRERLAKAQLMLKEIEQPASPGR